MNLFIYCDESGVFDRVHNDYYVFGGVIAIDKKPKDSYIRLFRRAEKEIADDYEKDAELKASVISPEHRGRLFRATNQFDKFGVVIEQKRILSEIFQNKKSKQRYLDYAFIAGIKNALEEMMSKEVFSREDIQNIYIQFDEHTTATNGGYEITEALLNECRHGTFNYTYTSFFKPIFPNMQGLTFEFRNSKTNPLVRASDIIANRIFTEVVKGGDPHLRKNLYITELPGV